MRLNKPLVRSVAMMFAGFISVVCSASFAQAQAEPLTIAAANSLRDVFRKVLPLFEAQHPEFIVRVVYGPSPTLRQQIVEGSPVDVFLPSMVEELDQLDTSGLLIQGTKRVYAGTSLVLITSTNMPAPIGSLEDLQRVPVRRIAVGDPKTSSVGKVTLQFLKYMRLESKLRSRYILGEHSRAIVDLVADGEAEVGVVYKADAVTSGKVKILDTAPSGSHAPVQYGVALPWTAKNTSGADSFANFLQTLQVQRLLQEHGFEHTTLDVGADQQQGGHP
ncbi:MAG: molybdate ABC transporter substrate-binding protein [Nitrospira sp. BO4]|nr:molybdate ABC transporter substrate-binding protein [Nitrospira sp. BO4]